MFICCLRNGQANVIGMIIIKVIGYLNASLFLLFYFHWTHLEWWRPLIGPRVISKLGPSLHKRFVPWSSNGTKRLGVRTPFVCVCFCVYFVPFVSCCRSDNVNGDTNYIFVPVYDKGYTYTSKYTYTYTYIEDKDSILECKWFK